MEMDIRDSASTQKPMLPDEEAGENRRIQDTKHVTEKPCSPLRKYKTDRVLIVLPLLIFTLIAFIAAIIIIIINRTRASSKFTGDVTETKWQNTAPCGDDWIWSRGKCYYFSTKYNTWNNSERFCNSHDASLALIDNKEELDLLFRYKGQDDHWIGLRHTEDNTAWTWTNGTLYDEYLFPIRRTSTEANEYVLLNSGDVRSEPWFFENKWICNKI